LRPLIALTFALLFVMGVAMWLALRPIRPRNHEPAVDTLRDRVYWAVVTMTTVGYDDKTPKTAARRIVAISWMLASVALISILSTLIVSRMTAERVTGGLRVTEANLHASGWPRSPIPLGRNILMNAICTTCSARSPLSIAGKPTSS
jgi:hypothetical protein